MGGQSVLFPVANHSPAQFLQKIILRKITLSGLVKPNASNLNPTNDGMITFHRIQYVVILILIYSVYVRMELQNFFESHTHTQDVAQQE